MTELDIYRNDNLSITNIPFVTVKLDTNSVQTKQVMGDNLVNLSFELNKYILFKINDWATVYGEVYKLNELPIVTKIGKFNYRYTLTMRSNSYDLSKYQFLFLGLDNLLRESDFSLMGNTNDFIDLVLANANRVDSGWTKGQVIESSYKNITFAKENCYNALGRIAEEFNTEFAIEGKVVHLTKRANDTGYTFRHGRARGLYGITRQPLSGTSLVTRLYAYGSEKNLPPNYQNYSPRLRFPGGYNPCLISNLTATLVDNMDGTQTFSFDWTNPLSSGVTDVGIEWRLTGTTIAWQAEVIGMPPLPRLLTLPNGDYEFRFRTYGSTCWVFTPGFGVPTEIIVITADIITPVFVYTPLPFLEKNVNIYGVIEHTEIFEDIYPHRTGEVSSVNALDPKEFSDASIDFNVNTQLLPGLTAKVTFNTGQLSGYTFELESFDNGTKKFKIQQNTDERILEIPSALIKPAIGDKYVLTDIEMPTSYVLAAEAELLAAAEALLVTLSEPQLSYIIKLDPVYLKRYSKLIYMGDLVWVVDEELELQKKIRVINITRNLVNEYDLQVELSDIVTPGTINRIVNAISSNDREVQDINGQFINNGILNNRVAGTLTFGNMPETSTEVGFKHVLIEDATGKLYKKV